MWPGVNQLPRPLASLFPLPPTNTIKPSSYLVYVPNTLYTFIMGQTLSISTLDTTSSFTPPTPFTLPSHTKNCTIPFSLPPHHTTIFSLGYVSRSEPCLWYLIGGSRFLPLPIGYRATCEAYGLPCNLSIDPVTSPTDASCCRFTLRTLPPSYLQQQGGEEGGEGATATTATGDGSPSSTASLEAPPPPWLFTGTSPSAPFCKLALSLGRVDVVNGMEAYGLTHPFVVGLLRGMVGRSELREELDVPVVFGSDGDGGGGLRGGEREGGERGERGEREETTLQQLERVLGDQKLWWHHYQQQTMTTGVPQIPPVPPASAALRHQVAPTSPPLQSSPPSLLFPPKPGAPPIPLFLPSPPSLKGWLPPLSSPSQPSSPPSITTTTAAAATRARQQQQHQSPQIFSSSSSSQRKRPLLRTESLPHYYYANASSRKKAAGRAGIGIGAGAALPPLPPRRPHTTTTMPPLHRWHSDSLVHRITTASSGPLPHYSQQQQLKSKRRPISASVAATSPSGRGWTAFTAYGIEMREKVRSEHSQATATEVEKMVGQRWATLTKEEKDHYVTIAARVRSSSRQSQQQQQQRQQEEEMEEEQEELEERRDTFWAARRRRVITREEEEEEELGGGEDIAGHQQHHYHHHHQQQQQERVVPPTTATTATTPQRVRSEPLHWRPLSPFRYKNV